MKQPRKGQYSGVMTRGTPPTERQRKLLRFIRDFIAESGFPPTVREIGEYMGIGSPNGFVCHLDSLIARGLIEVRSTTGRGIRLVGGTWTMTTDDSEAGRRLAEALAEVPE